MCLNFGLPAFLFLTDGRQIHMLAPRLTRPSRFPLQWDCKAKAKPSTSLDCSGHTYYVVSVLFRIRFGRLSNDALNIPSDTTVCFNGVHLGE